MTKRERTDRRHAPSRDEVLRFIAQSDGEVTKRDLVRAFRIKGPDRALVKQMMRELEAEGAIDRGTKRRVRTAGRLPPVAVLEVTGTDLDGDPVARPVKAEGPPPTVILTDAGRPGRAPGIGDRVLARLRRLDDDSYEGQIIRILPGEPARMVGLLRQAADGFRVEPLGAGPARAMPLRAADVGEAGPGEVVLVERLGDGALGPGRAQVVERLGRPGEPSTISLTMAHAYGLPIEFSDEAERQAEDARPVELESSGRAEGGGTTRPRRADLRAVPLVTIDGADARDFDDAVFAEPDSAEGNPGGYRIRVAIADVAHYVRPRSPLDREARRRGNSAYFPDRVLPMLPHALSSDLCSLRPGQDRACLSVVMRIDARGNKLDHQFERGLMRSAARLTYEQVQAAADGEPDGKAAHLLEPVIRPLYGAFQALLEARRRRGTLDLDLPETMVELGPDGRPAGVRARPRLDSHRLIEEFMILANVAAAEALEAAGAPCMYRIHERPDPVKLEALSDLLERFGLPGRRGTLGRPKDLARLLERVRDHELAPQISTLVLRAQSQARYAPQNVGHFGLNLGRYAHFTSPIRRYADLLVHRALIDGLRLGEGGVGAADDDWGQLGDHLSRTERRAMEAERGALARFVALFMESRIGARFEGTITGVQRFGLFVQVDQLMVDGLVPVRDLGREFFIHDLRHHALIGEASGTAYVLGDRVTVELAEADPLTGQLGFRLIGHVPGPAAAGVRKAGRRRPQRASRRR